MKAIAYSLFGYGEQAPANCFEFDTYMRGLMFNVRVNRVLYPNWINVVNTDPATYNSKYKPIFDWLQNAGFIRIVIHPQDQPLCKKMLWRVHTVFTYTHPDWTYTHVICRDIDSVGTYREAQAVQQWIREGKACHGITDSISHNIPMMGGMIGFRPSEFSAIMNMQKYDQLIAKAGSIDFTRKNTDQEFIAKHIYPKVATSITEHFVLGMRHDLPEGDGRHYSIPDEPVDDVPEIFKCTNALAGHIGAAGCYEPPMIKFLNKQDPYMDDYREIELQFPRLFYWRTE